MLLWVGRENLQRSIGQERKEHHRRASVVSANLFFLTVTPKRLRLGLVTFPLVPLAKIVPTHSKNQIADEMAIYRQQVAIRSVAPSGTIRFASPRVDRLRTGRLRNDWPNKRQDAASEPNDEAKLLDDVEKYGCHLIRNLC
jgi:hypothetical protein